MANDNISGTAKGCGEDVYYDEIMLRHVSSLDEVVAGTFYFDYDHDRIYIGNDPKGHIVETAVTEQAFTRAGRRVLLKNVVIEKFGSPRTIEGSGAIAVNEWSIENVESRLNHSVGLRVDNGTIRNSYIHHNGQLGLAGKGTNNLVENNEIAYNNLAGFHPGFEAGGSKWSQNDGLIVRGNYSHHNHGPGLWTDGYNKNVIYENNISEYNDRSGIFHELSYNAIIRDNISRYNG